MRELALFAGAGGGLLASRLLGWRTVCAVEIDPYCRNVLLRRQREGHLDKFPIWDDVRSFDGKPWRDHVDVISGGFPCQDISSAGKRTGLAGAKSGLWREFARIIDEVKPSWCFIENSPHLRTRGLVTVLQDLATLGYDATWDVFGGTDVGAPQRRERLWIVANSNNGHERHLAFDAEVGSASTTDEVDGQAARGRHLADADGTALRLQSRRQRGTSRQETTVDRDVGWWDVSVITGMDDGMAHRLDRARATGNGQISSVAALAWRELSARFHVTL